MTDDVRTPGMIGTLGAITVSAHTSIHPSSLGSSTDTSTEGKFVYSQKY